VTHVTGDFESPPVQSEDSARFYVSQSGEVSQSLTESQPAATPVCYSAPLTIGSLFSGIGGLELGLEWAGLGPVVWQVEQSEYCRAVLAKHWPDAKRYEDVRAVGAANLKPVDVASVGVLPCRAASRARVAHGVPARVDRLRALGNAVVPQVAEIVGHVILARENATRGAA
jgi:hypothetical protein